MAGYRCNHPIYDRGMESANQLNADTTAQNTAPIVPPPILETEPEEQPRTLSAVTVRAVTAKKA